MTSFLRSLLEDGDFVYVGENATVATESEYSNGVFDARVFWSVNAFILVMLTATCTWCFCFGGLKRMEEFRLVDTDLQYQQRVRDRQERRLAARRSTPAKRLARLKRSFQRNKVQMVVKEGDIIDEMPRQGSGNGGEDMNLQNVKSEDTSTTQESSAVTTDVDALEEGILLAAPLSEPIQAPPLPEPIQFCVPVTEPVNETGDATAPETDIPASTEEPNVVPMEEPVSAMEEGTLAPPPVEEDQPTTVEPEQPTAADVDSNVESSLPTSPPPSFYTPGDSSGLDDNTGFLVLRPGDTPKPPANPKMVPNCCAVCLGAYETGDTVVWSCNSECSHAFHLECILEWLVKIHDGSTPCPCCRQEFTSWETDRQERKIKWAAGHTFDMGAVSLR